MNSNVIRSFCNEIIKLSNTNVDGASNKNINSSKNPAKVPIRKGAPSVAAKNAVPKVKVNKPKTVKYAGWFKVADDPSKKPDPKVEPRNFHEKLQKIVKIRAKYPPPPESLKGEDARMDWRLDQKYHKNDFKALLEADNQHQVLQVNAAKLDSLPGDSLTFRQFFNVKPKTKLQPKEVK